jgi:sec-independent protein translocase protein TatC
MVFAALVTPTPDVLSMLFLAGPMLGLYFLAIGIGALRRRRPLEEKA